MPIVFIYVFNCPFSESTFLSLYSSISNTRAALLCGDWLDLERREHRVKIVLLQNLLLY